MNPPLQTPRSPLAFADGSRRSLRPEPRVGAYMTKAPHSIGADQTLEKAGELMKKYGFHHLPVLKAGKLLGIVSDHDLEFAYRLLPHAGTCAIETIMTEEPYVVEESEEIGRVLTTMLEKRIGSALVVKKDGHLAGVFTTSDVLNACLDALDCQVPDLSDD